MSKVLFITCTNARVALNVILNAIHMLAPRYSHKCRSGHSSDSQFRPHLPRQTFQSHRRQPECDQLVSKIFQNICHSGRFSALVSLGVSDMKSQLTPLCEHMIYSQMIRVQWMPADRNIDSDM